ncbi:hypothetical protein SYNPS1DRAFT_31363 [Syncephalis pseudoplumigaleata]|uniref:Uncharacterized protein n=1 Tax=Syncephalis pseudoplumigaleata TaxID=1712513 RepID=A0A4P9YU74_9FUNG|nr:hypothetical protein SYNPS1DRAFT_31363 [Syncephalis pseudoplumigaleata]|eukprot:RKP22952.1 hypothetical protein SYNPS1DRAFT_31363 [Syncephalis pseudoplumigaleata]
MPTYLPTELRTLPLVLTVMASGVWPCIIAGWLIYLYKYRKVGRSGGGVAYLGVLMLRTPGTAFFAGGAYLCQHIYNGPVIREELLRCLHMLIGLRSPQQLLEPYYEKLQVLIRLQWLILMGNVFPVAVGMRCSGTAYFSDSANGHTSLQLYYAVITRAENARQHLFVYLIQDVTPALYFALLLFVVRPRAPRAIHLSEKSLASQARASSEQSTSRGGSEQRSIRQRFISFTNNLPPEISIPTHRAAPMARGVAGAWQDCIGSKQPDE